MLADYFHHYAIIGFYLLVATLVPIGMIIISRLATLIKVRPNNPSELKKSMYGQFGLCKIWFVTMGILCKKATLR